MVDILSGARSVAVLLFLHVQGCACPEPSPEPHPTSGAESPSAEPFDADAAFEELERTLRETYAYLEREDLDVDALFARGRAAARGTTDAGAFRSVARRMLWAFTDPHLVLGPLADDDLNVWPTSADLVVSVEGDVFRVSDVRADSAADAAGVLPGDVLREVEGVSIADAVAESFANLVASPTAKQRAFVATLLANGRRSGTRRLSLARGDEVRALELPNPRDLAAQVRERAPLSVRREGPVTIVRFENSLGRAETVAAFDEAVAAVVDVPSLVIDLRNTPSGGNTDVARAILGHFVDVSTPYQRHEIPAVERATTVPRRFVEHALPRAPRFRGRVVVLGGRWTGSMGEGLVVGLNAAGATTVASDMGDLLGAMTQVPLERCDGVLELGVESLFHVDGTPRADYVADVPLESADRDGNGGDPALTRALETLRSER